MKNKLIPQFLSVILALMLVLSSSLTVLARDDVPYLSRGQACGVVLAMADDYSETLTRSGIIKGYPDGSVREDTSCTRLEAFVMISRAFGPLPLPTGALRDTAVEPASYNGIPKWAENDINNLINARVITNEDGPLDEYMTNKQMSTILRRVFKLKGSNLRDDYYGTVNKEWLEGGVIPSGYAVANAFNDLNELTSKQVAGIIEELAAGTYEKGTKEQKISDFYLSIADIDARNAAGITPIKPYLDAASAISSKKDLYKVQNTLLSDLACPTIIWFSLAPGYIDSTQYEIYLHFWKPPLTREVYADDNSLQATAWRKYMETLLTIAGEEHPAAKIKAYYEMGKEISKSTLTPAELLDPSLTNNPFTMDELEKLFPDIGLAGLLSATGFKPADKYIVEDVGALKALANYCTADNLELLKTMVKIDLLDQYGEVLGQNLTDASFAYAEASQGIAYQSTAEELAAALTQKLLGDYLGEIYIERYFSPEAKRDVEIMTRELIGIFKERLIKLDWMSEQTKQSALKKLETMGVHIGYPVERLKLMDKADIKSAAAGGNSFSNLVASLKAIQLDNSSKQGRAVDKSEWITPVFTVNAFYSTDHNAIFFPAAILQAPFYDVNAPRESNLGAIGRIIAHEITHAFDINGSQYDENGNFANWWSETDLEVFSGLCEKVAAHYDGYEEAPGLKINGALTLSENIADIGSVACIIDYAKQMDNPDWDLLFQSGARAFRQRYARLSLELLLQTNTHSQGGGRINPLLQNFEEFYETYGITEKDAMYIAPEKRVKVW